MFGAFFVKTQERRESARYNKKHNANTQSGTKK